MADARQVKRFYSEAAVEPAGDGWRVTLDGRAIKTARGNPQLVPTRALAEALAREWAGQGEKIDPKSLPLRDMADFALDLVQADRPAHVAEILRYGESDTLCYRAEPDAPLFARQQDLWEPLLAAVEDRHAVRFERVSGIVHRAQPEATLAALRALLEGQDAFSLAALRTLASLAASLVVALAALEDGAQAESLWAIANCEEDWQAEQWGWDAAAKERRDAKQAEFARALDFLRLARAA